MVGLGLLASGCASFDSLLAKSRPEVAQEHLATREELGRLLVAYDADSIRIHVRRVDADRAVSALAEYEKRPETQERFAELLRRMTFFTLAAEPSRTGLTIGWRMRAAGARFMTVFTRPSSLAQLTSEAQPDDCHSEQRDPWFPTLAELINPLLRRMPPLPLLAEKPYPVSVCPSTYDDVRIAPLATGLSMALDLDAHAQKAALPYEPLHFDGRRIAVGVEAGHVDDTGIALCMVARSWTDANQVALRYDAPLGVLARFFASVPKAVPVGKLPFTRSAVFVGSELTLLEGADDSAVDCLEEQFRAPINERIAALKLERRRKLEGARRPSP